jgi:4-hydroxybutyryl-CoA dehydratase/vinylacetyl-CoA-Delta-isomerase
MRTREQYLESLAGRGLELWVDGVRVDDPASHPKVRPAIEAVAETYALAHDPEHHAVATAWSDLVGRPVNRFTALFREPADLVAKLTMQRILGRITGTCFQRCVGLDGLNATFLATFEAGPERHERFVTWLAGVQSARRGDQRGAMTDPKGDRAQAAGGAARRSTCAMVERRAEGVVLRGAKIHQTGAANAHEILVMPGMAMRAGEEDVRHRGGAARGCAGGDDGARPPALGRAPRRARRGQRSLWRAGGGDRSSRTCSCPPSGCSSTARQVRRRRCWRRSPGYHRASYGGCKPGNLDVLTGAAAALADEHGVRKAAHVRDKLVEMAHLTETIHGLGLAASHRSTRHAAGVWQVDPVLANVCKHHVTRLPYEIVRLAEDLAGGLVATMPSLDDLEHPRLGALVRTVVGTEARGRLLRLVEWMSYGSGAVPLRIECMHGAGSPQAQRVVIERHVDWAARVAMARRLAGLA